MIKKCKKICCKIWDKIKAVWNWYVTWLFKWVVKLRMWYADIRGHHGKKWNYEPGDHYMGRKK